MCHVTRNSYGDKVSEESVSWEDKVLELESQLKEEREERDTQQSTEKNI